MGTCFFYISMVCSCGAALSWGLVRKGLYFYYGSFMDHIAQICLHVCAPSSGTAYHFFSIELTIKDNNSWFSTTRGNIEGRNKLEIRKL